MPMVSHTQRGPVSMGNTPMTIPASAITVAPIHAKYLATCFTSRFDCAQLSHRGQTGQQTALKLGQRHESVTG